MSSSMEPPSTSYTFDSLISSTSPSPINSLQPPTTTTTTTTTDDLAGNTHTFPPLTTHWTKPLSCTWTYNVDNEPEPGATGAVAWLDLEPVPYASSLSCYPDGMFDNGRTGVFSPGTCPRGWTTVELQVNTNEVKDDAAKTTAVCCSSEYYLDGNHCKRSVPTVLAVPITYNQTAKTYDILSSSTTTLYDATIAVYTIRVLFQEDDKDMLGLGDEDDISDPPRTNSGLSLSERIGIGVGSAIVALLLIGTVAFFLLRRRWHRSERRKGRPSHELVASCGGHRRTGSQGQDSYMSGSTQQCARIEHSRGRHDTEPPPAYEIATETNSLDDNDSAVSVNRDDEIRVLRVQKAVIQRRLEELEGNETETDQNQTQPRI